MMEIDDYRCEICGMCSEACLCEPDVYVCEFCGIYQAFVPKCNKCEKESGV